MCLNISLLHRCTNPGCQVAILTYYFTWLHLICVCPPYATCPVSPFWNLAFWGGSYISENLCTPALMLLEIEPSHSSDVWVCMVNCWMFLCQYCTLFSENMEFWQLANVDGIYPCTNNCSVWKVMWVYCIDSRSYEGHLESKERFAIKKYLLIIGKKKNMQVLSYTFTYFFT